MSAAIESPACVCDEGFHAVELSCTEDSVDSCDGVSCSGHGQCVEVGGVAECDCDEGYEAEGLECTETLCSCRERSKIDYSFCLYAQRCTTAADCCPDAGSIAPLICNEDDPYRYACNAGVCEALSCETDEHCEANFSVVQQNSPGVWVNEGCMTAECGANWRFGTGTN